MDNRVLFFGCFSYCKESNILLVIFFSSGQQNTRDTLFMQQGLFRFTDLEVGSWELCGSLVQCLGEGGRAEATGMQRKVSKERGSRESCGA